MYEDMRQGKAVVYIDPKGDRGTLQKFINMCRLTGREFSVFSEYYEGEGSCSINPVCDGTPSTIADRIHHSFIWTEEHYAQMCRDAVEVAVKDIIMEDGAVNLEQIYAKLLELSSLEENKSSSFSRKDIYGIISRLGKVVSSDFGEKLKSKDALSFGRIRSSRKCVYIGLSVLGYPEIARTLGKLVLGDISYCAYKNYKSSRPDRTPINITIDELSAVITDEFVEILNKARGAGIELTFAFQSPADISKKDQNLCVQVLENSSNWFVFKQRIAEWSQVFSQGIGTIESKKMTTRVQDGLEQDEGSQRFVEEFIVHPNILKNLNQGQCVLLRHFPTRVDLVNVKYINPKVVEQNLRFLERLEREGIRL